MPAEGSGRGRDPSGYITNPPSVVVKVTETARDDINGLMGIAISYNVERERYLVHMTLTQSTMALKKENLVKAGMMEGYRAQWQQLRNDPRVKDKMTQYLALCQQQVAPLDLGSVVFGVLFVWGVLIYLVGFVKTTMVTSLTILLLVIAGPDLATKSPPHIILQNFPSRSKEVIEKQMPFLKTRLTNRMATAIVIMLVAFCLQSLFFTNSPPPTELHHTTTTTTSSSSSSQNSQTNHLPSAPVLLESQIQKYYDLGYQDASNGFDHGSSLKDVLESLETTTTKERDETTTDVDHEDPTRLLHTTTTSTTTTPHDPNKQTLFSKITNLTNVASIFYLYRTVLDLGTETTTGLFSIGQLAANMQHSTEWWRKVLLVLSMYNVIRIFI